MYIIYMYISIVSNFHILLILRHVCESKYLVMNVAKYLIKKTFSNYILVCSKIQLQYTESNTYIVKSRSVIQGV